MLLKKSLIKIIKVLGIGFAFIYPFVVFFALKQQVAVQLLVLLLLVAAGLGFVRHKNIIILLCVLLFGLGLAIFNDDIFLKLYPVLMNVSICCMFALSLRGTPLITKFAKKMGYVLDAEQQEYTKRATIAWAIFMFCLAIVSLVTVFLSDEVWTVFNGLISYVLIGMMMGVEFIVRKKVANASRSK